MNSALSDNEARPSAVSNGFRNSVGTGTLALGGVISSIIVVRSLNMVEYGALSYYLWLGSFVSTLGLLAFPPALTKVVSELYGAGNLKEAERLIPWVGRILFVLNFSLGAVMVCIAYLGPNENRPYLLVIALSILPGALSRVLNSRVLAKEDYRTSMVVSVTTAVVVFIGVLVAHSFHFRTLGYEAILLSGGITQFLFFYVRSRSLPLSHIFKSSRVSRHVKRLYLSYLLPSTLLLFFDLVVWQRSEVYFLKLSGQLLDVGYYSISYTIFSTFHLLGAALLNGLFPAASHDFGAGDMNKLRDKSRTGAGLALFYGLPITFGGIIGAPTVLTLFYGTQVNAAALVSRILMTGVLPGALSVAMTLSLGAGGRVWTTVKVGALFTVINLILDLWLIPRYLAIGGAMANSATQIGYCIVIVVLASRILKFRLPLRLSILCTTLSVLFVLAPPGIAVLYGFKGPLLLVLLVAGYVAYWISCIKLGVWRLLHEGDMAVKLTH